AFDKSPSLKKSSISPGKIVINVSFIVLLYIICQPLELERTESTKPLLPKLLSDPDLSGEFSERRKSGFVR
ncbi:MAG: hypothetical protein WC400_02915, partial [Patescibacteria group bacterium]